MRVQFFETVESATPGFPFQIGQIVDLEVLTEPIKAALRRGGALALPVPLEAAVDAPARPAARTRDARRV